MTKLQFEDRFRKNEFSANISIGQFMWSSDLQWFDHFDPIKEEINLEFWSICDETLTRCTLAKWSSCRGTLWHSIMSGSKWLFSYYEMDQNIDPHFQTAKGFWTVWKNWDNIWRGWAHPEWWNLSRSRSGFTEQICPTYWDVRRSRLEQSWRHQFVEPG